MLNLSLAVYEAIAPRQNAQNLMTLLCVTQLYRQRGLFIKKSIKRTAKIHQMNF